MRHSVPIIAVLLAAAALVSTPLLAQSEPAAAAGDVTATLELSQQFYYAGDPLMVRISVGNNGDKSVPNPVKTALTKGFVVSTAGKPLVAAKDAAVKDPVRPEKLSSRAFYGSVVDLRSLFPALAEVGEYEISWTADGVSSRSLAIKLLPKYDPSKPYMATIKTNKGNFSIDFLADESPIAVKAFIDMANAGFYDGLLFHEVHRDRYIVGGDPRYSPTPRTPFVFPAEQSSTPIVAGTVVMKPHQPSPPANGSQFIVALRPEPAWTGQVTVVGQVVRGLDVLQAISQVRSSLESARPHYKPLEDVKILGIEVSERKPVSTVGS